MQQLRYVVWMRGMPPGGNCRRYPFCRQAAVAQNATSRAAKLDLVRPLLWRQLEQLQPLDDTRVG